MSHCVNIFCSFFRKMLKAPIIMILAILTTCTENRVIRIYDIPGGKSRLKSRSLHIRNNLQVRGISISS